MTAEPARRPSRAETARARAAGSRRRPALGRDAIVEVALRIVDAEGVDEVSMRRVAAEFDTGPASLYAYFPNKEALLNAVLDQVIEEIEVPDDADWQELLRKYAQTARDVFAAHNDIARLSFAHIPNNPQMMAGAELMLGRMIEGGVPPRVAAWSMDILALYIAAAAYEGYLLGRRFDDGSGRDPHEAGLEYTADVAESFAAAPPEEFPYLNRYAQELMTGSSDDRFTFGIDMLIAGFASRVPPRRRRR
ncbi:MAG: TetR/AcrR family transcriptional regulator C-terminal domain-containing protein [Actinobacteria bacterium]|nr:TetR/AcrR family transcriptional regulator C-terminal domain-containing protein [Actinomycetota bacterium]